MGIQIKSFSFNAFQECCSIVWNDSGECVIIDPGFYDEDEKLRLFGFIAARGLKPVKILLTHAHFDHIYGVKACVDEYGVAVMMHPADKVILENNEYFCNMFRLNTPERGFATEDVRAGEHIRFGVADGTSTGDGNAHDTASEGVDLEVIETPGHTPGGVCYLERRAKVLFSGDTLFAGAIGRTDNQWGDYDALMKGIFDGLMVLDGDIKVIPGHGPQTSIAEERMKNPFLMPFNEPDEE